ncbi:MAG: hypothetical protein K2Z25_19340 [Beijerinckiaceae bacterium]|nr:hypothetical protein [Beijerinckiaceae bacterium]
MRNRTFTITDPLHGLTGELGDIVYRDGVPFSEKEVFEVSTGRLVCKMLAPMSSGTACIMATIAAVEKADLALLSGETQRVELDRGGDGRWWITTRIRSEQTCGEWVKASHMAFAERHLAQVQLRRMVRAKVANMAEAA